MNAPRLEPIHGNGPETDLDGLVAELLRPLPWFGEAECGRRDADGKPKHDPDLWFPEKGHSTVPAATICNTACPVRDECREWAVATKQPFGVWGGMSVMERRAERRRQRKGTA